MSARQLAPWKGDSLLYGRHATGYRVLQADRYPTMWRVRFPDGTLSEMVNRTRAKDAAMSMLDRDRRPKHAERLPLAPPVA